MTKPDLVEYELQHMIASMQGDATLAHSFHMEAQHAVDAHAARLYRRVWFATVGGSAAIVASVAAVLISVL